jgi:hypothetical protein
MDVVKVGFKTEEEAIKFRESILGDYNIVCLMTRFPSVDSQEIGFYLEEKPLNEEKLKEKFHAWVVYNNILFDDPTEAAWKAWKTAHGQ